MRVRLASFVALLAVVALLPAAGSSAAVDATFVLPFSSGAVDPAADLRPVDPAGHDLVLVQFDREGATDLVDGVAVTGARLVQPLAPVSYLVWADAAQTRRVRAMDGVRFAGVLPARLRVAPSVGAATTALRVTLVGDRPALPGAEVLDRWDRAFTQTAGTVVLLPGGAALADRLAARPEVYSVADGGEADALRDGYGTAIVTSPAEGPLLPDYDPVERFGADGSGVVVAHVDGGVDATHPELTDRIAGCADYRTDPTLPCPALNNTDDAIGHGTHTLGIVMGTGSTGLGEDGFAHGQGVAPGATAFVQNAIGLGARRPAMRPLYALSEANGAIVSQNSWGPSGKPRGYDGNTRDADSVVRDADAGEPGDQPLSLVFSIMNGNGGTSTQGSPDEAKNIIGVGGTGTGVTGPGADDLCTCSAHGPALDGRMLPDLVAPGQNVMSTRAAQGTLCGLPGVGRAPSPLHASCTGTSMASPHVSGAYAVFVDRYRRDHDGATPSPALVKAALINQAVDLSRTGGVDADGTPLTPIPNNQQGWGRLNLHHTMAAWRDGVVHVDQTRTFDATHDAMTVAVTAVDPSAPLRVTLAWTDALGHGQGGELPAWVNDLDLVVTAPDGTTYLGNAFAGGWSVVGGERDHRNNVENVYLPAAGAGTYTVTVAAASIIGDGVPNGGDATDQDFALVVANATADSS